MSRKFLAFICISVFFAFGCTKNASSDASELAAATPLTGTWVRTDDIPGRQPADTLRFIRRNGKNLLTFYSAGSPGPNWPVMAETEYKFVLGKLMYRDYSLQTSEFFTIESFQWVKEYEEFSVKLYEILLYLSSDHRVTYQKVQ